MAESWYNLGFPDLETATDRQKAFVAKSWKKLSKVLSTEELCMIELMGRDEWVDGMTKIRAGEMIGAIKSLDDRKDRVGVMDALTASTQGFCPHCMKKMQASSLKYRCLVCGATSFRVVTR